MEKITHETFALEDTFCSDDDDRINSYNSLNASPAQSQKIRLEIQTQVCLHERKIVRATDISDSNLDIRFIVLLIFVTLMRIAYRNLFI